MQDWGQKSYGLSPLQKKCIGSMAGTEIFEMDDFAKVFHPHVGGDGWPDHPGGRCPHKFERKHLSAFYQRRWVPVTSVEVHHMDTDTLLRPLLKQY